MWHIVYKAWPGGWRNKTEPARALKLTHTWKGQSPTDSNV